jgi:hypothetical protein
MGELGISARSVEDRVAAVHLPTIYEFAETVEEGGFAPRYGCFLTGPRLSVQQRAKMATRARWPS